MDFINMPHAVYLVDLENVGTRQARLAIDRFPEAGYVVFYSDATNTPSSILEVIPENTWIRFIDCKSGGNNAMDFCICAVAGMLAVSGVKWMRILSNDKGYDPMVRMLQEQGIRIRREAVTYEQAPAPKPESNIIPPWRDIAPPPVRRHPKPELTPLETAILTQVPKKYRDEVMKVLPNAVNRKEAHEMLQAILPQPIVAETYKKLKKHIPREVA